MNTMKSLFFSCKSLGVQKKKMGPVLLYFLCFFALLNFTNGLPDCQNGIQTVPVKIQLPSGSLIDSSPGIKLGTVVAGDRVCIPGFGRFQHLTKYAHSRRVTMQYSDGKSSAKIELCIHSNASLGLGQCPQHKWRALGKGLWTGIVSPYETKFIDFRMPDTLFGSLTISVEEEFQQYHLVFLGLAFVMLILSPIVSKWVPFYYISAMAFGVIAVILFLFFQVCIGSLILNYFSGSLHLALEELGFGEYLFRPVHVGSVFLNYFSGLLHLALQEIGFGQYMFTPVVTFMLLFIIFVGAWVVCWAVRKLVLSGDGSVVAWAIRIAVVVLIFQGPAIKKQATQFQCPVLE